MRDRAPSPLRRLPVVLSLAAAAGATLALALSGPLTAALGSPLGPVLAGAVCVLVVGGAATVLVGRRMARLNAALAEVSAGDLQFGLRAGTPDEIGQLTDGIAGLVRALQDNYEELRSHDELRRRLVANVSHELRTPLTSMQGYLETAKGAGPGSPDFAANLEICLEQTRRLSRLVQDLFQLSKLDTQQLEFHFETVSLVELADQVGAAFEQRFSDKKIAFETRYPDEPLEVVADGNRLGQVITNLLGNASVFTPEGGKVTLVCGQDGEEAVCSVVDTGIGIAERDLPHIFESFFTLEKSRTRNLGGTGLGLAICKAIVDAHDGTIAVESTEGQGTTFSFRLKLAPRWDDEPED